MDISHIRRRADILDPAAMRSYSHYQMVAGYFLQSTFWASCPAPG
jgi:hypothetical protein